MRATPSILAILMLSTGAVAQQQANIIYVNNVRDNADGRGRPALVVGPQGCDIPYQISWTFSGTGLCENVRIWVTTGTCSTNGPGGNDKDLGFVTSPTSIYVRDLPMFQATTDGGSGVACSSATSIQSNMICGGYKVFQFPSTCPSTSTLLVGATIQFRGSPAGVPSLDEVTALDAAIRVRASGDSDTKQIDVEIREVDTDGGVGERPFRTVDRIIPPNNQSKITGLTNNTLYEVRVRSEDAAGNISAPSPSNFATPLHSDGFIDTYRRLGGEEKGGCGSVPGGLGLVAAAPILALVSVLLRRKRSCRR